MKFLVDAQLPLSLKTWLRKRGYDTIHTRDLPRQNLTDDKTIIDIADRESRIIISKDGDFYKHHLLKGQPKYILMLTTGNLVNKALYELLEKNFSHIESHFKQGAQVIEMNNENILVHV